MKRGIRHVVKLDILQFKVLQVSAPLIFPRVFYAFKHNSCIFSETAYDSDALSIRPNYDSLSLSSAPIPLRTMYSLLSTLNWSKKKQRHSASSG
jgi:hypothetical protein